MFTNTSNDYVIANVSKCIITHETILILDNYVIIKQELLKLQIGCKFCEFLPLKLFEML